MRLVASFGCLYLVVATYANAAELIVTCGVGPEPMQKVGVVRDSRIASTYIYYLRQGGTNTPFFVQPDQSRGDSVLVQCVGKKRRTLVVSGEFSANALQGFVISSVAGTNKIDRLDFAEKSRPQWLYTDEHEVIVVTPTFGYGETNSKYVAYRHTIGQTDVDQADGINDLPSPDGYEVMRLSRPRR
jgi:hypothetical protein